MRFVFGILVMVAMGGFSLTARADDQELEFFEKKIRPVLVTYCYECHSADSKKPGGELLLDSREGVRTGGESGPAIQTNEPDESLLLKAVRYTDDNLKMPPKGKLPEAAIADLESWVKQGAKDPRDRSAPAKVTASWSDVMRERSNWWSLQPALRPDVPPIDEGTRESDPVDRFVQQKLAANGLNPASPTDPRTFARRLSLVLTGLPPTIEQVDHFVAECRVGVASELDGQQSDCPPCVVVRKDQTNDPSEHLPTTAVERLVDALLQSPHFGEQWARHWMDVIRFSETHGNEWNYEVHHAWRYRDYLIRAFNDDVPYDQFVREHIAGDLLPEPRWNEPGEFNESVIGTGFYRFGEVNHDDCISLRSLGYDLADNQIDTLTKAFQATTVACARCHNHKLDAISSDDYYALLAVLRSSRNVSHCIDSPNVNAELKQQLGKLKSEVRREIAAQWREEASLLARYLQAAHAARIKRSDAAELAMGLDPVRLEKWVATLAAEKQPFEDPFQLWRRLSALDASIPSDPPGDDTPKSDVQKWSALATEFAAEESARTEFNRSRFVTFADFGLNEIPDWSAGGQALRDEHSHDGDFVIQWEGDSIIQSILPAGRFTHVLSAKQNGTLRSRVLPSGKKYISFQVLGQRSSAVRLVSNNCQLNYANYRALTSADLQWVTFSPPDDRESLQTYAELMTMFDNPKFPDQLAALGGDPGNYKMPWEKAAENPRSYFGVTRVVLHDSPETPKPEVSHLRSIFHGDSDSQIPTSVNADAAPTLAVITARYASRITGAIDAWSRDKASKDDVRWLDAMLRRELLENKIPHSPRCVSLVQQYRTLEAQLSVPRVIVGLADGGPGIEQPVFIRGDCSRPGEVVPRRYLEVLSKVSLTTKSPQRFVSSGSGRMELADQIASPNNPLTARVMVNRIWHHLFGTGLVRTVDDFGHVGEPPSHPELLDHLANQFIDDGWSVKRMIRTLVLTQAFRASNRPSTRSSEVDPQNRLLQHYSARRMEAEGVRDSILAASGRLDFQLYGLSIQPYREKEYADRRLFPGPLDGNGRRSIYIKNNLMESPKFLAAFNFPGGKVAQGRRDVTNVPAQALALLNDPFVLQQADVWAQRELKRSGDSIATRIESMFQSSLGRSPTAEEQFRFEQLIRQLSELYQVSSDHVMNSQVIWKDVAHALFNLNEMIYIP